MDRLDCLRVFIQVAEMGSFVKAAHALDLPPASVSAAVQQLETALDARLLHRTTRRVQLTVDGSLLLERARTLLADADALDGLFRSRQREVSGRLKIDMPSRIARRLVAPALPELLRRYPHLQIVLGSSDRIIDLVQEGVDCAVRVGQLGDSSLVAQSLGRIDLVNCASAAYLHEAGMPEHPRDLAERHWAVAYAAPGRGRGQDWEWQEEGREQRIAVRSRVLVDNAESYIACCRAGLGAIQVPRFDVQHLLDRGELVEILPAFRAAPMEISVLYPHRRHRSRRLKVFIDWFSMLIRPQLVR